MTAIGIDEASQVALQEAMSVNPAMTYRQKRAFLTAFRCGWRAAMVVTNGYIVFEEKQ